jgi:type III pantothenate kinase
MSSSWLALNIGNSHLHWALLQDNELQSQWDTPHLDENTVKALIVNYFNFDAIPISLSNTSVPTLGSNPELWIASVVAEQSNHWRHYASATWIDLAQIPLQQMYSTLGIDRALSLWGAVQNYGSPALVVDCGTALTLSGVDRDLRFMGGAIIPGLQLQLRALGQGTSALPMLDPREVIHTFEQLPSYWGKTTIEAMHSGILHTVLAGIATFVQAWLNIYSSSTIVLTGGDALLIYQAMEELYPGIADAMRIDQQIIFRGMLAIRNSLLSPIVLENSPENIPGNV